MSTPYDLLKITPQDLKLFKEDAARSKIGILINLILDELPKSLRPYARFANPYLKPIKGFEDEKVRGYEVIVKESKKVERFVKGYVPFFILEKEG